MWSRFLQRGFPHEVDPEAVVLFIIDPARRAKQVIHSRGGRTEQCQCTVLAPESSGNFAKLSLPPSAQDLRIELKTQLPNGQSVWLNMTETQLPMVLRALSI
jgi:hypothetical protein